MIRRIKEIPKLQTEKVLCYVCNNGLDRSKAVYIGLNKKDQPLYRHQRCAPGTVKWLNSKVGRKSEIKTFFEREGKDNV